MGIPDHLTCLLRKCMQVKKQKLEPYMEQQTGSKPGKKYVKAVYCHPAYLNSMQSTSCEMLGWMKHSWNQDCQEKYHQPETGRWYHHSGRKWRGTKEPLDEVKEESEKAGSKLAIPKTKIMASGPITSRLNDWTTTKCSLPHSSGYAFPKHLVFIFKTSPKQKKKSLY